jgi:3-hydroxyisobutyrate dehydrogenase-like beta-hydroxyacid dehydrogenase
VHRAVCTSPRSTSLLTIATVRRPEPRRLSASQPPQRQPRPCRGAIGRQRGHGELCPRRASSVTRAPAIGAFFLDLNSVAPGTKRQASAIIEAGQGHYVEAAVMSPIHPKRLGTPLLLGGAHAAIFLEVAQPLGLNATIFSDAVGAASAVKMCRSIMVKGLEALTLECFLSARRAGVESDVLASLQQSFPGLNWAAMGEYNLERMASHGIRRAAEMREVVRTVEELGIAPLMATATAEHQDTMGHLGLKHQCGGSLPAGLGPLLDAVSGLDPWRTDRSAAAE